MRITARRRAAPSRALASSSARDEARSMATPTATPIGRSAVKRRARMSRARRLMKRCAAGDVDSWEPGLGRRPWTLRYTIPRVIALHLVRAAHPRRGCRHLICLAAPGEKRGCRHVYCSRAAHAEALRRDFAPRSMVDPAARRFLLPWRFRRLCDLGSAAGGPLCIRALSFAVLLPGDLR